MIDPETRRKLRELNIPGILDVLEMMDNDSSYASLSFDDRVKIIADYSYQEMTNAKVASLLKAAKLRLPQADISNIDYEGRPLDRNLINELGTAQFVSNSTDIILRGFTGTGKSHLACAIAKQACKNRLKTFYTRMPDLLSYRTEKISAGWPERKVLNKFAGYKVLVLDEYLIDKLNTDQMHFMLELTERRYDNSSTIYCTQYSTEEWHKRMGGGAHAESIMDRIVHNAINIWMGDVNMRERMRERQLAEEKAKAERSL